MYIDESSEPEFVFYQKLTKLAQIVRQNGTSILNCSKTDEKIQNIPSAWRYTIADSTIWHHLIIKLNKYGKILGTLILYQIL